MLCDEEGVVRHRNRAGHRSIPNHPDRQAASQTWFRIVAANAALSCGRKRLGRAQDGRDGADLCCSRRGDFAPRVHRGTSQLAMFSSARPVAVEIEAVGDRAVDGHEALALTCRLEPDHASFLSSNSQMRILRPVI
jgi:hypothetical protein